MARLIDQNELDRITDALQGLSCGATIHELAESLGGDIATRTLQRRLAMLIAEHRVTKTGKAQATRYHLAGDSFSDRVAEETEPGEYGPSSPISDSDSSIPFGAGAHELRAYVARPTATREPISYQRKFLDSYRPNETFYLSEAERKHLRNLGQPNQEQLPAGTYASQILDRLLIDLSFNSSRLEGNTYSMLETKRLIENGKVVTGKEIEETQMILNHKEAIRFLVEGASEMAVDAMTIRNLHAILSDNLLGDPAEGGRLRDRPVSIGASVYLPSAVPQFVEETFLQLVNTADRIRDPFEQSFFLLTQLPYLQPFIDVNKRVSRLAANIPLIRDNLRPLSFIDVAQDDYVAGLLAVYELNRVELLREVFVWAYERSAKRYAAIKDSLGSPDEFRLQYRSVIKDVITAIIRNRVPIGRARDFVEEQARDRIPAQELDRFQAVIEAELVGLQEWNFARYHVSPKEFRAWVEMDG